MNILAIDYGQKNIGLAWMQLGLDIVLPYGRLKSKELVGENNALVRLIHDEKIDTIVIGLPLTLDEGTENANTLRVRGFGDALGKEVGVPIVYVDERLSSFEADEMGGEVSRDEKAAMVIMHNYKNQLL